jgi:uncharacterized protein
VLKTFVANELHRLAASSKVKPWLFHLRTVKQKEVDFVLEARDGRIVGIEVVPGKAARQEDFEGLKYLDELSEGRFHEGIVLHDGDDAQRIAPNLVALPYRYLWG